MTITTIPRTQVVGREEVEDVLVKKTGRFIFFKTEWWEKIASNHIGSDIFINTDKPIRNVFLNGEKLELKI